MEASLSIAETKLLPHSINQPAHMHTNEIRIEEFKQNDLEWGQHFVYALLPWRHIFGCS